jgi:hypothetical protein
MTTPRPILTEFSSQEEWEAALDKWFQARMNEDALLPEEEEVEDRYDRFGNYCENGLYDAGGHLLDDWYDRVDEDAGRDR